MKHIFTTFKHFITKPLLVACALLAMSSNAWGATVYAKVTATADPKDKGGYVYVGKGTGGDIGTAQSRELKTDNADNSANAGSWNTSGDVAFRLSAYAKDGYTFKGWRKNNADANEVVSSANPWDMTVNGQTKSWGSIRSECQYQYYAIFAKLTATKNSIDFSSKNVESGWGNSQTIKVTGVHVGDVTATIPSHCRVSPSSRAEAR